MTRLAILALGLLATPALADTLSVTPIDPAHPPIVNAFPTDPLTHTMFIPNLTPFACQDFLAKMQGNPLSRAASCATGPVDKTQWHGGFVNPPDPGA